MSRLQFGLLLFGCSFLLTCQASPPQGSVQTLAGTDLGGGVPPIQATEGFRATAEEWSRSAITETGRIDAATARLAVYPVLAVDEPTEARLDPALLGESRWLLDLMHTCGLATRKADEAIEIRSAGSASLQGLVRRAIPMIQTAMDCARANVLARRRVGHRAVQSTLQCAVAGRTLTSEATGRSEQWLDPAQGPLMATDAALDVAVFGRGLLCVEFEDGPNPERAYTRDGRLERREDGLLGLRTRPGAVVIPKVSIPADVTEVVIQPGGDILIRRPNRDGLVDSGRLGLAWFKHPELLVQSDDGLLRPAEGTGRVIEGYPMEQDFGEVLQGRLELSNVVAGDAWTELCRLEDARQVLLAVLAEVNAAAVTTVTHRGARGDSVFGRARGDGGEIISIPLSPPRDWAAEPTLVQFLRRKGLDFRVESECVQLWRRPSAAEAVIQYLQFLRTSLNALSENIAHASGPTAGVDDSPAEPYRRKYVRMDENGKPVILEDPYMWAPAETTDGYSQSAEVVANGPTNEATVELEVEMADVEALTAERRSILDALSEMGAAAVPGLTGQMRQSNVASAKDAAFVLGRIGAPATASVPALVEALAAGDWELRKAAAAALGRIAPQSEPVSDAVVDMWVAALHSEAAAERRFAAICLGRKGPAAARAVPVLISLLKDPTCAAATALGQIGDAAAVPALIEAVADGHPRLRAQAIHALGRLGPAAGSAMPVLRIALGSPDNQVRALAASAIGLIGVRATEAIEALARCVEDDDPLVRQSVMEALARLGVEDGSARGALTAAMGKGREADEAWAAASLSAVEEHREAATQRLSDLLSSEEASVRFAVCKALCVLGRYARFASPLLLELCHDQDDMVAGAAIEALGASGSTSPHATAALALSLQHQSPLIRQRAACALGKIGQAASSAAPALCAELSDRDDQVVLAAVEALGRIGAGAAEAVPMLQSLAGHENPAIREAVCQALLRVTGSDALTSVDGPREGAAAIVSQGPLP